MERNEIMVLDDILYHLYDEEDFRSLRHHLLEKLHMLLPFSYASILLTSQDGGSLKYRDPVCDPYALMQMEEEYIKIAGEDHTSWSTEIDGSSVICESMMLSDEKRLATPIYRQCYSRWNIYDSLQVNISYRGILLAVLTLYRTREEGAFTEGDLFPMRILSHHLNRLFYRHMILAKPGGKRAHLAEQLKDRYSLTAREEEILTYLLSGDDDASIAGVLSISPATLKKHLQHIYRKMEIGSRWELLKYCV